MTNPFNPCNPRSTLKFDDTYSGIVSGPRKYFYLLQDISPISTPFGRSEQHLNQASLRIGAG
jgi:hypothetical protein